MLGYIELNYEIFYLYVHHLVLSLVLSNISVLLKIVLKANMIENFVRLRKGGGRR